MGMTTNQTIDGVLRELLEHAYNAVSYLALRADDVGTSNVPVAEGLRALLDAKSCGACNSCSNGCRLDTESPPAAQPHGEPVARHPDAIIEGVMTSVGISHAIYASTVSLKHGEQVKLYAEQPAPVAVVMPERNTASKNLDLEQCGYVDGWNACLDEMKHLNPSL